MNWHWTDFENFTFLENVLYEKFLLLFQTVKWDQSNQVSYRTLCRIIFMKHIFQVFQNFKKKPHRIPTWNSMFTKCLSNSASNIKRTLNVFISWESNSNTNFCFRTFPHRTSNIIQPCTRNESFVYLLGSEQELYWMQQNPASCRMQIFCLKRKELYPKTTIST